MKAKVTRIETDRDIMLGVVYVHLRVALHPIDIDAQRLTVAQLDFMRNADQDIELNIAELNDPRLLDDDTLHELQASISAELGRRMQEHYEQEARDESAAAEDSARDVQDG